MYQTGLNHAFLAPEVPLAIKKELGREGDDDGQMMVACEVRTGVEEVEAGLSVPLSLLMSFAPSLVGSLYLSLIHI